MYELRLELSSMLLIRFRFSHSITVHLFQNVFVEYTAQIRLLRTFQQRLRRLIDGAIHDYWQNYTPENPIVLILKTTLFWFKLENSHSISLSPN